MAQIKTNLAYGVTGTIPTANIADDAITSAKLADDSVVAAAIADNAVVTAAINADAITAAKVADDIINSEHIAAGGIDTEHIADDQITLAKMAGGTDGNIITYDASGNPAVVASGTSGHFLKSQGADTVPVFAAAGGGKIVQVVNQDNGATAFTTSSTKSDVFTATITPTNSNNVILATLLYGLNTYGNNTSSAPEGEMVITLNDNTIKATTYIYLNNDAVNWSTADNHALSAYWVGGTTSALTVKCRFSASSGRLGIYGDNSRAGTTSFILWEIEV